MTLPIQSKRIRIPVLLLLAAAGVLFVCLRGSGTDPSPLKHGPEAPAEYGAVPAPAFDHPSGFYDGPFDLAIAVPEGARVYYTLDCSYPDESGIPYGGPVRVEDATPRENVYSVMPDTRPFFLHESPEIRQYVLPEAPVDKCTVLRAVAVSESGVHSPVAEAVYFVGPCAAKYREGTVVSVIVDPEELFDEETGIYVAGSVKKAAKDDPAVPANYFRTGAFSRRRASALFFRDGACGHGAIPVTLRLKGHSSRAYLPKSLDLTALDAWGNAAFFPDGLAPGEILAQTLTLSMAGQDQVARFNDHMVGDRCRGLACGVMRSARRCSWGS